MTHTQFMRVEDLKEKFQGDVLLPGDAGYDEARKVWNAMIDKRPAVIAQVATQADVVRAVNFARESRLPLAVRGGGHNIAGSAVCDDGIVIDFSRMKAVNVDAAQQRAMVEAGATLADVDAATQAHGLATPIGINSTTGIAGLTLGGGFGWLSRKYGMTVDNLESADVVTAAGQVVKASATENPELFWALRGGGGNFGIVTRFEFRLHKVGPDLFSGLVVYPLAEAKSVLQQYREFMAKAPDELNVWVVIRKAPPLPFLPENWHGKEVVVFAFLYAGDPKDGERLIEPLRKFGKPVGEAMGAQPFAGWQQAFDPLLTAGARNYWKSHNFTSLDDKLFDVMLNFASKIPGPQCEIIIAALGGATMRPAPDATAYVQRDATFVMNVHGRWDAAADDPTCIAWSRELFQTAAPFATGGVYINFMTADEQERVKAAYGPNYDRLARAKKTYDPNNLFSMNQNIRPA